MSTDGTPSRCRAALCFISAIFTLLGAKPSQAVCRLGPLDQPRVAHLDASEPGLGRFNKGLIYLDRNCPSEAAVEFAAAIRVLDAEASRSLTRNEFLDLSRAGLALAKATLLLISDRKAGILAIHEVIKVFERSQVTMRAAFLLTTILSPTAPEWDTLSTDLEILANTGYWKARKALLIREIAAGRGAAATSDLERRLNQRDDLQQAHALRILLAEAYQLTGRTLEAWIAIRSQDPDAGEEILDWELRVEFLRVAASIARARAAQGDTAAARAATIYETASREVQTP